MALAQDILHNPIINTALPYDVTANPVNTTPVYVGGLNVLTSYKKFAERRPGFEVFESAVTTFSGDIRRLFVWQRWGADFYAMLNEVTATQSIVYKFQIGTDASFISIFTSSSTEPFDFVVSNNHVFFGNGTDMQKWDATTVTGWGITSPAAAPSVALNGAGALSLTSGRTYVVTYGNSTTGHQSSPSPISASSGSFTNDSVDLGLTVSPDAQVDEIHAYGTTDGGGGIFFEITGSPFANATATVNDATTDANLSSTVSPTPLFNDPPPAARGFVWYANRIWMFVDNQVHYTGWEEITTGVEEESLPSGLDGNFWAIDSQVTGLGVAEDGVLVFRGGRIYKIEGDSQDTFRLSKFVDRLGLRERATISSYARLTAWLDVSDSVWITDGFQVDEIGIPIRSDLKGIDHSKASMTFHADGEFRWLCLLDGEDGRLRVYDFQLEQWMPPWTVGGGSVASWETSAGVFDLLVGHSSHNLLKLNPNTFEDDGTAYGANLKTNLFDIAPTQRPGGLAVLEYVSYEHNSVEPQSVSALTDDDPLTGSYQASADVVNVPQRTNGVALVEKWAYFRKPKARRASVRFDWSADSNNFRLYSFDLAHLVTN